MPRRPPSAPSPTPARLAPQEMQTGIDRLERRRKEVEQFDPTSVQDQYNIPEINALTASIEDALVRTFGSNSTQYNLYKDAAWFDNGPHNYAYEIPMSEVHKSLARSKARSLALISQAINSLQEQLTEQQGFIVTETNKRPLGINPSKVFIVHGHDNAPKSEAARFVEKLGFEAIILHGRPNKGRTLIAKFREEAADVGFAVVLLTPDDVGKARDASDLNPRARQNVVLELGFFLGQLGPDHVAALVKGDVELPSDFDGVVYIQIDEADWQIKLGRELKEAGYSINWNKVMGG